jgi:periplasmic protein TonB
MVDYAAQQRRPTKHLTGFGIVIVLHLFLGWALVSGLARKVVDVIKAPIETKIVEEIKPPPPPPENLPPPPKTLPPPPSFVPPPEVVIQPPPTPTPTITVQDTPPPPAPPPAIVAVAPEAPPAPPAAAPAPRIATRPAIADIRSCAPSESDYPAIAVKEEATGDVKVRFTIDASGKVVSTQVVSSAGPTRAHKALDRVVIEKVSSCRFTPGSDAEGRPTTASFDFTYGWKLN